MRRADLRVYDIRLIGTILGLFCTLSAIFFVFLFLNLIDPKEIVITRYLWTSYGILVLAAGTVYVLSRRPPYEWVNMTGATEIIGKPECPLEKGATYLIDNEQKAEEIISESLIFRVPCLYVTQTNPDIVRKRSRQICDASLLWLTELKAKNTVNPADMEELSYMVEQYLSTNQKAIVLFAGLPYMLNALPFNRVLFFIQDLRDKIAMRDAVLILWLPEGIIGAEQYALVEREVYYVINAAEEKSRGILKKTAAISVAADAGSGYLIKEPKNEQGLRKFADLLGGNATGLMITRTNPREIRLRKEFENVRIIWLTEIPGEGKLKPTDLEELSYQVMTFLNTAQNPIIYVDGFEYLANYNNFTKVLLVLKNLKDALSTKKAMMLISVNPGALEKQNLKTMELEFKVI